ncbi:M20/M25/M40 family metallo-hydrolase [Salinibacter sp.]|uniref:M20/M25/M40 family metallo-hydrolase n=1 Tax=Salinibacter sp. TaxID=2065818 RepID=UPI0021E829C1|nr:M20/M25/M40 family metallo-hydrolase [Salinibacter sp.]
MAVSSTHTTDAVDLLKALVRLPSLTGEEAEIADFVEQHVRRAGVDTLRHEDNVAFGVGEGDDTLLLNSHLDVVPPSDDHPYDPFEPVEVDGVLYGRGAVDAKASGAAMTTALLSLAADGWAPTNGRLLVGLTTHEESGGPKNGLQDLRPDLPSLSAAVVGEPTTLRPCVAQKGLLILKIHARGTAAHAGRAHLGDNAIPAAMTAIQQLEDLSLDRADPHLGAPTATVTTIEGGEAHNVVPEHCVFTVDLRTTPAYTHDEIAGLVSEAVDADVKVYSDRLVPCATPEDARIVQAAQAARPDAEPFGSPTSSDWVFLHDVPTVKMGPGPSNRSHTAAERIDVDEVKRAVTVYRNLIRAYFSRAA